MCFAVRHVLVSLYLMGLYQWVFFFGKSSNGGFEFGHGFGYGHGFFILCCFPGGGEFVTDVVVVVVIFGGGWMRKREK